MPPPSLLFLLYVAFAFTPAASLGWAGAVALARPGGSPALARALLFSAPFLALLDPFLPVVAGVPPAWLRPARVVFAFAAAALAWRFLDRGRVSDPPIVRVLGLRPAAAGRARILGDGAILALAGAACGTVYGLASLAGAADAVGAGSVAVRVLPYAGTAAAIAFAAGALRTRHSGPLTEGAFLLGAAGLAVGLAAVPASFAFVNAVVGGVLSHHPSFEPPALPPLLDPRSWPAAAVLVSAPVFFALRLAGVHGEFLRERVAAAAVCAVLSPCAVLSYFSLAGAPHAVLRGAGLALAGDAHVGPVSALLLRLGLEPDTPSCDAALFALARRARERGNPAAARAAMRAVVETCADSLEHAECMRSARNALDALERHGSAAPDLAPVALPRAGAALPPPLRVLAAAMGRYDRRAPEERLLSRLAGHAESARAEASELGALARAARAAGAAPVLAALDRNALRRALRAGHPAVVWLIRGLPHELARARRTGRPAEATLAGEFLPRAVLVAGYEPRADAYLSWDGTQTATARQTAREIVRGAPTSPQRPVTRALTEIPAAVLDARAADLHDVTLFAPSAAERAGLLRALGLSDAEARTSTEGLLSFFDSRRRDAAGDRLEALRAGKRAQRLLPRMTFLTLYNDVLVRRLDADARAEGGPDLPAGARDAWRQAVAERLCDRATLAFGERRIARALDEDSLGFDVSARLLSALDFAIQRGDARAEGLLRPLCQHLCRVAPVNAYFRVRLDDAALEEGDWESVVRARMALLDLFPRDDAVRLSLAEALAAVSRDEEADAVAAARRERAPAHPAVRFLSGLRHARAGRAVAAREALGRALLADPLEPLYAVRLAGVERDAGRHAWARRSLAWADRVDPRGASTRRRAPAAR